MRRIEQPGPVDPLRIESHSAPLVAGRIDLQPGDLLMDAVAKNLAGLGLRSAALDLSGLTLGPLHFVIPAVSATTEHVAFYSETHRRPGPVLIDDGAATYGSREGAPFLHGHLFWRERDGRQSGGHVLPAESRIAAAGSIGFKGCREIAMSARFDPETNFTLFGPVVETASAPRGEASLIVAKIRPNEDLIGAIEEICRRHGVTKARLGGLIGSLVGARFEDGVAIESLPTEILGLDGSVERRADGGYDVDLELALIDDAGKVYRGRPRRGENPVLICIELFLERC
ncbi:MAG TPA: DUF296 domain-containing protein [Kiloniellaceae bacterium]|nr:DUF296 domain-containing protein [Kiloniellaceae bacterium]